jgi:hypothetical protein
MSHLQRRDVCGLGEHAQEKHQCHLLQGAETVSRAVLVRVSAYCLLKIELGFRSMRQLDAYRRSLKGV